MVGADEAGVLQVGCPEDSGQRALEGFAERDLEIMGSKRTRFSVEFKTEAVRMVVDGPCPIAQVARELKMNSGTLGNWVDQYRAAHPVAEEPLTVSERVRLRELESEVRELRMKNEFLGKAGMGGRPRLGHEIVVGDRLVTSAPTGAVYARGKA